MKVIRGSDHPHQLLTTRPVSPHVSARVSPHVSPHASPHNVYFFYEKNSGVAHFHVQAGPDGSFPIDQAAALLAMHCLVRGQAPSDYAVLVQTENEILENLMEKADKLLEAGRSVHGQVRLTRREEEVLAGVLDSLSNKEIASNLHLSERTVKFHVSSLLAKFQVRGRMELVREAARHTLGMVSGALPASTREARDYAPPVKSYAVPRRSAAVVPLEKRQLMA